VKRKDIKAGDELYYSSHRDWQISALGGLKVVVVDPQPYSINQSSWGRTNWHPTPRGTAVLVKVIGRHGEREEVVPIAHLHGPYEQVKAAVEEAVAEEKARRETESKKTQDEWAAADALADRAQTVGIHAVVDAPRGRPEFRLSRADLLKLLDAYTANTTDD
jgi:hypothetical protein